MADIKQDSVLVGWTPKTTPMLSTPPPKTPHISSTSRQSPLPSRSHSQSQSHSQSPSVLLKLEPSPVSRSTPSPQTPPPTLILSPSRLTRKKPAIRRSSLSSVSHHVSFLRTSTPSPTFSPKQSDTPSAPQKQNIPTLTLPTRSRSMSSPTVNNLPQYRYSRRVQTPRNTTNSNLTTTNTTNTSTTNNPSKTTVINTHTDIKLPLWVITHFHNTPSGYLGAYKLNNLGSPHPPSPTITNRYQDPSRTNSPERRAYKKYIGSKPHLI